VLLIPLVIRAANTSNRRETHRKRCEFGQHGYAAGLLAKLRRG
jgi:hypothetical protein